MDKVTGEGVERTTGIKEETLDDEVVEVDDVLVAVVVVIVGVFAEGLLVVVVLVG